MPHDDHGEGFEQLFRALAGEVSRSLERAMDSVDIDAAARSFGVDPDAARDWVDSAGAWLRTQLEDLGADLAGHAAAAGGAPAPQDPLRGDAPHPLDLPNDAQGLALAALSSGRWTIEPDTQTLTNTGGGSVPDDALGTVLELRIRDWVTADGQLTEVGRHALTRWLEAAKPATE